MYQYTDFDRQFIRLRAEQFRDQLERWQARQADRRAVPPPAPAKRLVRAALRAHAARGRAVWRALQHAAARAGPSPANTTSPSLPCWPRPRATQEKPGRHSAGRRPPHWHQAEVRLRHFTTRTNVQFNWIPLSKAADVMDLLATVQLHGIQTSGNCIRNINSDALAGIAADEIADPGRFAKSCASGARCTPSSRSCPASSRSPSTARARRPRRFGLVRRGPAAGEERRGRAGLQGARGRRHGPHAHHQPGAARVPALEPAHELPKP